MSVRTAAISSVTGASSRCAATASVPSPAANSPRRKLAAGAEGHPGGKRRGSRSAIPAAVMRIAGQGSQPSTACVQEPDRLPASSAGSGGRGVCTTTPEHVRAQHRDRQRHRPAGVKVVEPDRDHHGRLAGGQPEAAGHRRRRRLQLNVQRGRRAGQRPRYPAVARSAASVRGARRRGRVSCSRFSTAGQSRWRRLSSGRLAISPGT